MVAFNEQGRFYVGEENNKLAEIDFTRPAGKDYYVILHTGVRKELSGQGVAQQLVDKVVDKARHDGLKIVPVCPYAKKRFTENEQYADVWYKKT